jgi:hypothetical protein
MPLWRGYVLFWIFMKINCSIDSKKNILAQHLLYVSVLILGYVIYVMPIFGWNFEYIPGDLGDSRLNNYFLEHAHKWISSEVQSFWNAQFFYPVENVMSYSDNHLGSFLIYSVFRLLGCDRELSYQLWFLIGIALNYYSIILLLRQYKLNCTAVIFGAFLFAFSAIAVYHMEAHSQLLYRFALPLIWYFHERYRATLNASNVYYMYACLALQFYLSIYIGYFAVLLMFGYYIAEVFSSPNSRRQKLEELMRVEWRGMVFFVVLVFPLLYPYAIASLMYGVKNSKEVVLSMLPRMESYILNPAASPIIGSTYNDVSFAMKNEHFMYFGAFPLGVVGYFTLRICRGGLSNRYLYAICSFWFVFAVTFNSNGYSLYKVILMIPGVDSIRAMARVSLVMLLPISVLVAVYVDQLQLNIKNNISRGVFLLCMVGVFLLENKVAPYHFKKEAAKERVAAVLSILPQHLPGNTVLVYLNPNVGAGDVYLTELDIMLTAQALGVPTLNGYSGRAPQGHRWLANDRDVLESVKLFMSKDEFQVKLAGRKYLIVSIDGSGGLESHWLNQD